LLKVGMGTIAGFLLGSLLAAAAAGSERAKTIHVFVALCDNEHQGIVHVPEKLGNGEDPANNLYWGALYGTKTFLQKSKDWTLVRTEKDPGENVLERAIFRHRTVPAWLIADAYRGDRIKNAVEDFLNAAAGHNAKMLNVGKETLGAYGAAALVIYLGHNGLMDFDVEQPASAREARPQGAVVLACKSKPYFQPRLSQLQCRCILLTTGFMAPEAYTLEAAVAGWLAGEPSDKLTARVARAYDKYQQCGLKAAGRLFYSEPQENAQAAR
jgi:hypothetical protein